MATFLRLASHVTGLMLQSDWDAQIPPRVVNRTELFAQSRQTLFPPRGWGLGTRLVPVLSYCKDHTHHLGLLCTRNCLRACATAKFNSLSNFPATMYMVCGRRDHFAQTWFVILQTVKVSRILGVWLGLLADWIFYFTDPALKATVSLLSRAMSHQGEA